MPPPHHVAKSERKATRLGHLLKPCAGVRCPQAAELAVPGLNVLDIDPLGKVQDQAIVEVVGPAAEAPELCQAVGTE